MPQVQNITCPTCNQIFERYITPKDLKKSKSGRFFCSKSCAGKYNNKHFPKRELEGRCKDCGIQISSSRKFCKACFGLRSFNEKTKEEVTNQTNPNSYIRMKARQVLEMLNPNPCCSMCGYSKVLHVHHIRSISSFGPEAKIKEINDPRNLVYLCPNHHAEQHKD